LAAGILDGSTSLAQTIVGSFSIIVLRTDRA
jgi:hypothetical protein